MAGGVKEDRGVRLGANLSHVLFDLRRDLSHEHAAEQVITDRQRFVESDEVGRRGDQDERPRLVA